MKRILFCLMALVALASPVRAYFLYEISGPVEGVCYGSTYTLNGVSYKIYACCDAIPVYAWHDIIQPLKFVAFITSLDDVTTEECVIPASFEHTGISFATGPIVINGVLDYRYIWTTSPRDPGTGGNPANVLPSTVEVWGFSSYFNSSTNGDCSNSEIKSLRFEGELRTKEETVMVYDNAATVEFFNEYPRPVVSTFTKSRVSQRGSLISLRIIRCTSPIWRRSPSTRCRAPVFTISAITRS